MAASIIAGLLGSLVGAILISGAIYLAFKLFRLTIPRFPNLWKRPGPHRRVHRLRPDA
jgi:hypothetical protein